MDFLLDRASVCDGDVANHQAHPWFAYAPGCGCRYRGTLHGTSRAVLLVIFDGEQTWAGGFSPAVGYDFF